MFVQLVTIRAGEADTYPDFSAVEADGYLVDWDRVGGRHLREELRGQPTIAGFCGPMWGGTTPNGSPIIRYEAMASPLAPHR